MASSCKEQEVPPFISCDMLFVCAQMVHRTERRTEGLGEVCIEVIMRCLLIRCARCQKDDTEAVLDEINKVCAEFGIKQALNMA